MSATSTKHHAFAQKLHHNQFSTDVVASLIKLRMQLAQQNKCFPVHCCELAARAVEEFAQLKLPSVGGLFIDEKGFGHPHKWNRDPHTGTIVDLTVDQFGYYTTHDGVLVVDPDSQFAKLHYLEDVQIQL